MSSTTMIWPIHPVTLADAPHVAHNNMSAFWTDPSWRLIWPSSITLPYLISQCSLRVPRNLLKDRATLRHQKAVDPATGALLGYARWKVPDTKAGEWLDAQMKDVESEAERKEIEERANGAWWELREGAAPSDAEASREKGRMLSEREYLVLEYLAVHPDNKGKGIATALVESGLRQAKTMGLPVFIFAFKAGRGVYERLGFKEVWRIIQDDTMYGGPGEYGVYLMVYDVETP
ncbi:Acetyltransferase [Mycena venus]|uniref:Acetyltransferase n=1 Tax=Mycena venus TaxID=2733690 RepID=A0A8H6X3E9_9AGAR|nr:Acetyltransferase [Mycena venus]